MQNVIKHLREKLSNNTRYLVAVSGGADSMALLSIMHKLKINIVAAHYNHGIRKESDEEAEFVINFCNINNIDILDAKRGTPFKGNIELAARKARYEFLVRIAKTESCTTLVTAHHQDDQAETVFQNIIRGTGINGLRGMPESKYLDGITHLRPMLDVSKEDLIKYNKRNNISWVEDPSNHNSNNRAIIRNQIFPLIRKMMKQNPVNPLVKLSKIAKEHCNET